MEACAICLEDCDVHDLVSPCRCRGSMAYKHPSCLFSQIKALRLIRCPVCKETLATTSPMPTLSEISGFLRILVQLHIHELILLISIVYDELLRAILQYGFGIHAHSLDEVLLNRIARTSVSLVFVLESTPVILSFLLVRVTLMFGLLVLLRRKLILLPWPVFLAAVLLDPVLPTFCIQASLMLLIVCLPVALQRIIHYRDVLFWRREYRFKNFE